MKVLRVLCFPITFESVPGALGECSDSSRLNRLDRLSIQKIASRMEKFLEFRMRLSQTTSDLRGVARSSET